MQYLNSRCHNDGSTHYKLFFLGRHGEGWHNAAETFYGTPAWNVSKAGRSRLNRHTDKSSSATGPSRPEMEPLTGPIPS